MGMLLAACWHYTSPPWRNQVTRSRRSLPVAATSCPGCFYPEGDTLEVQEQGYRQMFHGPAFLARSGARAGRTAQILREWPHRHQRAGHLARNTCRASRGCAERNGRGSLKLWQNSTVDQFNLSADFDLAPLTASITDEASRLGLQALEPLSAADMAKGYRLFADGPTASLSVIMMCQAHLSCQLWWMQDEAAVEVTFTERFLPGWALMRSSVAAFLTHMQER